MYQVQVKRRDGWDRAMDFESYREAVDQADLLHGRVAVKSTGFPDEAAHTYAVAYQGFEGDYGDWRRLNDAERDDYEHGAGPCTS